MVIKYFLLAFAVVIPLKALVEARHLNERNYLKLTNLEDTLLPKTAIKINNSERLNINDALKCLEKHTERLTSVYDKVKEEIGKCTTNKDFNKLVAEAVDKYNHGMELRIHCLIDIENCDGNSVCIEWTLNIFTDAYYKWQSDIIEFQNELANILQTLSPDNQRCIANVGYDVTEDIELIFHDTETCVAEAIEN